MPMMTGVRSVIVIVIGPTNERYERDRADGQDDDGDDGAVAEDEGPVEHRPLALVERAGVAGPAPAVAVERDDADDRDREQHDHDRRPDRRRQHAGRDEAHVAEDHERVAAEGADDGEAPPPPIEQGQALEPGCGRHHHERTP